MRTYLIATALAASLSAFACSDDASDADASGGQGGEASSTGGTTGAATGGTTSTDGMGGDTSTPPELDIPLGTADPKDAECDLSGAWLIQTETLTEASVSKQSAWRWYLVEIAQDGEDFEFSTGVNCSVMVDSSLAKVTLEDDALQGIISRNSLAGLDGTFAKNGDQCDFSTDRFYTLRGADKTKYLPAAGETKPLSELSLPALPTRDDRAGSEDWDGDGIEGLRFRVGGLGNRNSVQRDAQKFYSDAGYTVALNSESFTVRNDIEMEETVIDPAGGIVTLLGTLDGDEHPVNMIRLGDSRDDLADLPEDNLEMCRQLEADYPPT